MELESQETKIIGRLPRYILFLLSIFSFAFLDNEGVVSPQVTAAVIHKWSCISPLDVMEMISTGKIEDDPLATNGLEIGMLHIGDEPRLLKYGLANDCIQIIDINISRIDGRLMAAHPPIDHSGLALEEIRQLAMQANQADHYNVIKLDVKDPADLPEVLATFVGYPYPLLLNLSVASGPGAGKASVEAKNVIAFYRRFFADKIPNMGFSLGWKINEDASRTMTKAEIEEMLAVVANWEGHLIFPIPLRLFVNNFDLLAELLEAKPQAYLSLYSIGNRQISENDLWILLRRIDEDKRLRGRVILDFPASRIIEFNPQFDMQALFKKIFGRSYFF